MTARNLLLLAAIGVSLAGCGPAKERTPAQAGRIIYMTNCTQCHGLDPNQAGTQGPAIAGSSHELVEDRVLHLTYPAGYTPKRTTHAMRAFPQLTAKQIDDLTAFLDSAAKPPAK